MSATNPETGTVSYAYNADGSLATKTDARGQAVTYTYDALQRVTAISTGLTFTYDTALNGMGRLATATQQVSGATLQESYSYTPAGGITAKALQWTWLGVSASIDALFGYDNEGRLTSTAYPADYLGNRTVVNQTYDSMGRPLGLTQSPSTVLVENAQYGAAGQLTHLEMPAEPWGVEDRTYNALGQLTRITNTGLHAGVPGPGIPVPGGNEQRADHADEGLEVGGRGDVPVRHAEPADLGGDDGTGMGPELQLRWVREPDGADGDQGDGSHDDADLPGDDEPDHDAGVRLRRGGESDGDAHEDAVL